MSNAELSTEGHSQWLELGVEPRTVFKVLFSEFPGRGWERHGSSRADSSEAHSNLGPGSQSVYPARQGPARVLAQGGGLSGWAGAWR